MQTLHARMRCAPPPHDILSRVTVGVVAVSTSDAFKDRLALATSRIHDTAGPTGLRGEGRVDLDHPTAVFLHLVGEDCFKPTPALIQDRAVEARFLAHPAARLSLRACGRGRHGLDMQIFQGGDPKAARDVDCGPVVEVAPEATGAGLQASHTPTLASVAARAALAPRQDPLSLSLLP